MDVAGAVAVVTGGAGGIGAALVRRLAAADAAGVVVADRDGPAADALAEQVVRAGTPALATRADVAVAADVAAMVEAAERRFGRVDILCSNAGVAAGRGLDATGADWADAWHINVMAHVYAANAVLPGMLGRRRGCIVVTCSAAGVLSCPGDAPYTATKHAAVGLAEWLAITYGDQGIHVSALCPQGVRTPMLLDGLAEGVLSARATAAAGELLDPDDVADAVLRGIAEERFLILPHPEVAEFIRRKADDPDRWLAGLRRMVQRLSQA